MPENNENNELKENSKNTNYLLLIIFIILAAFLSSFLNYSMIKKDIEKITQSKEKEENTKKRSNDIHDEIAFFKFGEFIVNLSNKEAARYIKTDITIEFIGKKEMEKEIKMKESIYRDKIINILSNYTTQQLYTKEGKEKLKKEILNEIKDIIHEIEVKNIYFNTFIMQ